MAFHWGAVSAGQARKEKMPGRALGGTGPWLLQHQEGRGCWEARRRQVSPGNAGRGQGPGVEWRHVNRVVFSTSTVDTGLKPTKCIPVWSTHSHSQQQRWENEHLLLLLLVDCETPECIAYDGVWLPGFKVWPHSVLGQGPEPFFLVYSLAQWGYEIRASK